MIKKIQEADHPLIFCACASSWRAFCFMPEPKIPESSIDGRVERKHQIQPRHLEQPGHSRIGGYKTQFPTHVLSCGIARIHHLDAGTVHPLYTRQIQDQFSLALL
jgi:hypothetical protein